MSPRLLWIAGLTFALTAADVTAALPRVRIAPDGRTFETTDGRPFVPFGVNYFRPGTGWAPQVWKQFDPEATRRDFARMKELGVNCVRVFLTYGSFLTDPGVVSSEGLERFDQFLAMAEAAGVYVHPTGPDHWEGLPEWARTDRLADERVLTALESFWQQLAARYRDRPVLFAYDLLNEPEVAWDSAAMRQKWNRWLQTKYRNLDELRAQWSVPAFTNDFGKFPVPSGQDAPDHPELLDYQRFRETVADEWTRRQVSAIKASDPDALVTVGLIQWSVPVVLAHPRHYSAFRPSRQARWLDFLEVHFYPLEHGAYEYRDEESERRNLSYLESVVREVARPGKPVVIAEFGWYGGGKPSFDGGRHPVASEEQQARWCRKVVESSAGLAVGWLNWGFFDQPEAKDATELMGLVKPDGTLKMWGREFQKLAGAYGGRRLPPVTLNARPDLDWEACVTSDAARRKFRDAYLEAFRSR